MAVRAEPKSEFQASPIVLLLGVAAVGAGLYFLIVGQRKTQKVNAHYSFNYRGPPGDYYTGLRFGDNTLLGFNYRTDWKFCKKAAIPLPNASIQAMPVEGDMIVELPLQKPPAWSQMPPLPDIPYTYDAKFGIMKLDCSDYLGAPGSDVTPENVITQNENLSVNKVGV